MGLEEVDLAIKATGHQKTGSGGELSSDYDVAVTYIRGQVMKLMGLVKVAVAQFLTTWLERQQTQSVVKRGAH